ncbi:hypothetical protein SRABI106_00748 [Rahnella aquatilis]|nr:hypothetical protein SRABI106_00748 [Rahnella aquatilis]
MCDANHIIIATNIFNNILSGLSVINSHCLLFSCGNTEVSFFVFLLVGRSVAKEKVLSRYNKNQIG